MSESAQPELQAGLEALTAAGLLQHEALPANHAVEFSQELSHAPSHEFDDQTLSQLPALCPPDADALSRSLAILAEHHMTALIRGGGSRLDLGNSPRRIDVLLEMRSLSGVSEFERDDGVVNVRAGTRLSALREEVESEGWRLRLDPAGAAATVGGTLASAAVGPRVLGFGMPRDCVLGLDVVLANGEQTRCGGRVVKNVTGFDMAKLYTGSLGTLAVIAGAWLRLAPIPESEQTLMVSSPNFENMFSIALEASRRSTAGAAALLSPAALRHLSVSGAEASDSSDPFDLSDAGLSDARDHWLLVVELAGDEAATRSDAEWLFDRARKLGVTPAEVRAGANSPAAAIDRVRELQGGTLAASGVRVRIAALPSALPGVVDAISQNCAALVLHPGVGLVYGFSAAGEGAGVAALDACCSAAAAAGGSLLLEALPPAAKQGREVFGEFSSELALMRELKRRFDPTGVLNPGRFAGGI